jgi:hypothetical protein
MLQKVVLRLYRSHVAAGEDDGEEADIRADIDDPGIGIDESAQPLHLARLIGLLVEKIGAMKESLADAPVTSSLPTLPSRPGSIAWPTRSFCRLRRQASPTS